MKKRCEENENIWFFSVDFKVPHDCLTLYHTIQTFNDPEKEGLENLVGKRENAFSPFPTIIFTLAQTNFYVTFILSTPNAFNLDRFKDLSVGKDRLISVLRISSRRNMDERRGRGAMKRFKP